MEHARHPNNAIVIHDSDSNSDSESSDLPRNSLDPDEPGLNMFSNGAFGRTPGQANAVHVDFNFTDLDGLPERYSPEASMSNTVNFDTVLTEQECQQKILDVFPDIERDHVLNLIRERSAPVERTARWCERLIGAILDGGQYPKERDKVKELKRKRSDDEDDELIAQYENARGENQDRDYFRYGAILLQDEFREIPVKHIENTLRKERTLFKAFDTLETQLDNYGILKAGHKASPFSKIRTPRASSQQAARKKSQMSDYVNLPQLQKEFAAARKQRTRKKTQQEKAAAAKLFEDSNTRRAQENNEMKECMCCYSDFPINRMAYCNGSDVHFFCVLCTQKYVENELSMSRCRPICFADLQCKTLFTTQQLRSILDKAAFERLELLQQQEDIRLAGLDNLEECPFCDFKAECPPVEVDREFRCMNLTCEKISCRLCRAESHIPMTCEEHQKENKASVRHAIEEAMTKALIRSCNRCKKPFVKDYGCNKMTCPSCGNAQCYVCGTNVSGNYDHFHNSHGRCPLYDNTDQRHQDEVKKAEEEALAILRAQHPNLSAKELKIQVSDRVKAEEEARIRRGADHAGGRLPLPIGFAERIVVPGRFGPMRRVDMPGYYPPPRGAVDAGVQAAGPPLRWQPVGELDLQQWVHAPPPFQAVGPPGVYLPLQAQAAAAPGNGNNNIAQPFVPVGPHEWAYPGIDFNANINGVGPGPPAVPPALNWHQRLNEFREQRNEEMRQEGRQEGEKETGEQMEQGQQRMRGFVRERMQQSARAKGGREEIQLPPRPLRGPSPRVLESVDRDRDRPREEQPNAVDRDRARLDEPQQRNRAEILERLFPNVPDLVRGKGDALDRNGMRGEPQQGNRAQGRFGRLLGDVPDLMGGGRLGQDAWFKNVFMEF